MVRHATSIALFLTAAVCVWQQPAAGQGAAQQSGNPPATAAAPAPQAPPAPDDAQQPNDAQQPTPIFRGGVNFVRVDVIVNDGKGEPVTNLTEADFEVLEDGKPQTIEQFRLVRVDGNPPPGAPPPRELRNKIDEEIEVAKDDVRLFVLFFDDYHVRLGNSISIKEPLIRFVQTQLRPNDIVGIMYPLTPVTDITLTRNQASIISAIERFEGRKFDYRPRNMFEEQYARAPSEVVEQIRNQVVMTALRGLFTRLGGMREGRKAVIYVSEGLTAMLPPQLRVADASLGPLSNPGPVSPMAGENSQREETASFFAQSDLYSQMRDVFTAANRNNAAIYALDPRGLTPFEYGIDEAVGPNQDRRALQMTQDTLRSLAEETDGRAIVNRNDMLPGLAQIVRDSSYYYLLGYNSSQAPSDGKFHQISVRLKRRGLDVRARKGYWALTTEDITRASRPTIETPKPIQTALASISTSVQAGKYVRTWLGTSRGDQGKTRVTLLWEALPQAAGARREQPVPGRLSLIAANMKGDLVFRGRTPDAASAPPPAAVSLGPQRLVFDAAPGEIELRMNVEEPTGGTLDTEIRKIVVPDLTSTDAGISTPRVHRARNAREFQTIAADPAAVPAVARDFSRTERLLIRFEVYGNATPTAVLMNRNGNKMADVPIVASPTPGTQQIDLSLASIAAGEYLIEITAQGATGEAKELVPLRIGS